MLKLATPIAALAAALSLSASAHAFETRLLPPVAPELPSFGMHTYFDGVGERVVRVRPGGIAWQMGLERGDTILRMNRVRLRYDGAWWNALDHAIAHGGQVRLMILDGRTGRVAFRSTHLGVATGPIVGPVTPKAVGVSYGQRLHAPPVVEPPCDAPARPRVEPRAIAQPAPRPQVDRRGSRNSTRVSVQVSGRGFAGRLADLLP